MVLPMFANDECAEHILSRVYIVQNESVSGQSICSTKRVKLISIVNLVNFTRCIR